MPKRLRKLLLATLGLVCLGSFMACDLSILRFDPTLDVLPSSGKAPLEVTFDASASTGVGLVYEFDLGDGSLPARNTTGVYTHVYGKTGTYDAKVTITSTEGDRAEEHSEIVVNGLATLNDLKPDAWTQLFPEGSTTCSDGSDYSFFVAPGETDKLVIDFQGGGACWNDYSCSKGGTGTYAVNVYLTPEAFTYGDINGDGIKDVGGIYDRGHAKNPVKDWHHIYVSYCTGDVHWGNSVHTYTEIWENSAGQDNVIHHKGSVNAKAVLNWVFANYENPETIFVTGCSAGAYGAAMWTPHIARQYPNADIRLMADCGAGVVNEDFIADSLPIWKVFEGAWPSFIPALNPEGANFDITESFIDDIYSAVGQYFPNIRLSQFNTMGDGNQIFYYALMENNLEDEDGDGYDEVVPSEATITTWLERMPESMDAIEASTSNYVSYLSMFDENADLSDGTAHCVLFRPEFYDIEEKGVPLSVWLNDFINGEGASSVRPESVPTYNDVYKPDPGTAPLGVLVKQ